MSEIIFNPVPVEYFGVTDELKETGLQTIANTENGPDIDTLQECANACDYLEAIGAAEQDVKFAKQICYDAVEIPKWQDGKSVFFKFEFVSVNYATDKAVTKQRIIEYTLQERNRLSVRDLMTGEIDANDLHRVHVHSLSSDGLNIYIHTDLGRFEAMMGSCPGGYFAFARPGGSYCNYF